MNYPFKLTDQHGGCGVVCKVTPPRTITPFKLSDIPGAPKRT